MKALQRVDFCLWFFQWVCSALFLICTGWNCAHQPAGPQVALYAFEYQGERYRIRSVYSSEGESFNELIGPGFLARDVDQNGTLDQVVLGNFSLSEAQKIYAHALDLLRMQNRLKQIETEERVYQYQNSQFVYEIKTGVSRGGMYANTFKVFEMGQALHGEKAMARDTEADGTLEEIVKGEMTLPELQAMYAKCISKGLEEGKLIKEHGWIIVKR